MCGADDPATVDEALAMLDRALAILTAADAALLPAEVQAGALRALERAEARHTVARARMLAAFSAQDGYEDDGHGSARVWLRWQTRVTKGAAAGAVGWMRRLAAHPVIAQALADGEISASWAKAICGWSERLPLAFRDGVRGYLCVHFFIQKDGTISGVQVVLPSSVPPFNRAVLGTLSSPDINPLPPLPEGFPEEQEGLSWCFFYNMLPGEIRELMR